MAILVFLDLRVTENRYTLLTTLLGICENVIAGRGKFLHSWIMEMVHCCRLKQLPHTADYFTLDEELKREKLIKLIKEEITQRKYPSNKRK